jgi:hypothetical protein
MHLSYQSESLLVKLPKNGMILLLLTSLPPGITKNASSSTAPEAVSQPINGCAAQD